MINTLYMYTSWADDRFTLFPGYEFGVFDAVGFVIAVLLFMIYFVQFFKDKKVLAKQDPLKK